MIPVENKTAMPIYVGADMVPPGETRLFHEHQVPMHLRPAVEAVVEQSVKEAADPIADLATETAKEIIARLPDLTDEQLNQLAAIEQAKGDEGRKTVLAEISELLLTRAEAAEQE